MRALLKAAATRVLGVGLLVREWAGCPPFIRLFTIHDIAPAEIGGFAALIDDLRARYAFIDPARFLAMLEAGESPAETAILLTFDDAYASHLLIARDILAPRGIRGFFFIPTAFVGLDEARVPSFVADRLFGGIICASDVPRHSRPMGWADVEHLAENGHAIGAHTRTHSRLSSCADEATLEDEIGGARLELEHRLGRPVVAFAYPFGDLTSISVPALRVIAEHYRFCFSGIRGRVPSCAPLLGIPRDAIDPGMPPAVVDLVVRGAYEPLYGRTRQRLAQMVRSAVRP